MKQSSRSGGDRPTKSRAAKPGSSKPPRSHSARRNARREPSLSLEQALETALAQVLAFEKPADRQLSEFFRAHKSLGRRDRAIIADRVFDAIRQRRLYAHLAESGAGAIARRIALIADAAQPQTIMRARETEQAWLADLSRIDRRTLAPAIQYSMPDWLWDGLQQQTIPGGLGKLAASLLQPAALDVRANLLKTDVAGLQASLAGESVTASAIDSGRLAESGTALRIDGHPAIERLAAFSDGLFEVQDAGSQWVAHRAGARRGQTVVDFCAGAGGKTLAMAAMMRGTGQIYACDTSLTRLSRLKPRLARSGASNVQPMHIESEHDKRLRRIRGRVDLVLVDAPCSGTGTLRRNPDLKWRQQAGGLARLAALQLSILTEAARLLKPGGRLIYVTCSLLEQENEAVAWQFEQAVDYTALGLKRLDMNQPGQQPAFSGAQPADAVHGAHSPESRAGFVRIWPHLEPADGFFMAGWQKETAQG